jgi:hypothetical protein
VDCFGTRALYPSAPDGESWCLPADPARDARARAPTLIANGDGSFRVTSTQVRWEVFTSGGSRTAQVVTDQGTLARRGYMQSPRDWRNVEITMYVRANHATDGTRNGPAHFELQARGARHTDAAPCEGTGYHLNTYVTGRVKLEKELEHTAGYTTADPQVARATAPLTARWIGLKAVTRDRADGSVELEHWVDDGGGAWRRVLAAVDAGAWGGGAPRCGGTPATVIAWGGPIVVLRWDEIDDVDVRAASVREIEAP